MLKVLFLILLVMSSVAFAHTQEKQQAYKFFEFENVSKSLLKEKWNEFYNQLKVDKSSQGYIINYGKPKEVAKREKQIRELINFREYDAPRITFVRGENVNKLKSVFWIVPAGAEMPKP